MKLAIGTVQFGLDYGVSNIKGRTPPSEVKEIFSAAANSDIDTIDTAASYGNSESILGTVGVENFKIITKIPAINTDKTGPASDWVFDCVKNSLNKMKVNKIEGLLLHNPLDLIGVNGEGIAEGLMEVKKLGLVQKVGYSIYTPEILPSLLSVIKPDIVQAPFNIFDQRLKSSGWLRQLDELGIEVHVRSIFLQGLLLMKKNCRPAYFERWDALWRKWDDISSKYDPISLCMGLVKSQSSISRVVIGVETLLQFKQLLYTWDNAVPIDLSEFELNDSELIDPFNWNLK